MKFNRMFGLFVAMALLVPLAVLANGDSNLSKYLTLQSSASASGTSSAVDVAAYKGNSTVVVNWGTGTDTTYTGTVTVTHCATSGGTYTTITNLAGTAGVMTCLGAKTNELDTFALDLGATHKYVKIVTAHVNATNPVGVVLVAPMKSE